MPPFPGLPTSQRLRLTGLALAALVLGLAVYALARESTRLAVVPGAWTLERATA